MSGGVQEDGEEGPGNLKEEEPTLPTVTSRSCIGSGLTLLALPVLRGFWTIFELLM